MNKYDLIIIGGGAGAFAAAIKANELGAKTAMINDGLPLGGTCVNVGCVPSKTLLYAGELLHLAKNHGVPGIELEVKNFDFQKVVADELALVEKMRSEKYEKVLKNLEHVKFIEGRAKFVSATEVEVPSASSGQAQRITADKFIIATGSTANVPPMDGLKEAGYITHIEALKLEKLPEELVIVGGGAIALEFAQMFSRFGTKVTMLVRGDAVFRFGDKELVKRLLEIFEKEDIAVKTNTSIKSVRKEGEKKVVIYSEGDLSAETLVKADEILLAAGKTANTKNLGLEIVGVETNDKKSIVVNENFQTKNENVFAVGDVAAMPLRLETTAGREGTLAADNALTGVKNKIDYDSVPYTVFTDPQLAGVGLTEDEQMKRMKVCACRTVSFDKIPKAAILRRTEGLISMSIHPETQVILGVHILAPNAGELIAQAMMLIKNKNTIDDVINSLPMFPTLSEAIKLVALSFRKDISKLSCCV